MKRIVLFVVAAVLAFVAPGREIVPLAKSRLNGAHVMVLGNSAITHRSKCDSDQRTIPAMMADESGFTVTDLSTPGQLIDQSVNIAGAGLSNPNLRRIVLTFSLFDLADYDTTPLQEALLHRTWNRQLTQSNLLERVTAQGSAMPLLVGRTPGSRAAFEYKSEHYPEYEGIKRNYFVREKAAMKCPEHDGYDPKFVEAFHAFQYTRLPMHSQLVTLIGRLEREARRSGVKLDVALLPINVELMARMEPALVADLKVRVARVSRALEQQGVTLTDLSAIASNDEFADRWCACGHLLSAGRLKVARQLLEPRRPGARLRTEFARLAPNGV